MWRVEIDCTDANREWLIVQLGEHGTLGIIEKESPGGRWCLEAYFPKRLPIPGRWKRCRHQPGDWREHWQPLEVGERFYMVPYWRDDSAPAGRLRLTIFPRQASGTGHQAATQLALIAMERALAPGMSFLDVGTGTGILAAAAALLGAAWRVACDIDPQAVTQARENATPAQLVTGSPRCLRPGRFDVVAANLNAQAILALRDELRCVLAPAGRLILSGFKERHVSRLIGAMNLPVLDTLGSGDWRCLVLAEASVTS